MTRTRYGLVADPTIRELLRAVFRMEQKRSEESPYTLDWPGDVAGQGRCIHHLAEIAESPALPFEMRTWAFGELEGITCDYQEKGDLGGVPVEMLAWYFGVGAGWFEPPKRKRGRPGGQLAFRNRMIVALVGWLRGRGATRRAAMDQVAEAACVSPETVKTVLGKETEPGPETVARRERLFREYVELCREGGETSQADIEGMEAVAAAFGLPPETARAVLGRGQKTS